LRTTRRPRTKTADLVENHQKTLRTKTADLVENHQKTLRTKTADLVENQQKTLRTKNKPFMKPTAGPGDQTTDTRNPQPERH
jgi:hypothetical protein